MLIGAIFPQLEIGTDPVAIRDYAQAVEGLGFHHLLAYDHVLGASTATRPHWTGPYTDKSQFHEPFVLFGYLAGLTQQIEFTTGVIILPQRQTALVAKQATEVDVLSGGRLRLGVGVGWNPVEYEGLGKDFHTRGRRVEEQIALLRHLFAAPVVTFEGRWEQIRDAGLNPLPAHRIPIWFGGGAAVVLARVATIGDGWFPQTRPEPEGRHAIAQIRAFAQSAGRDPAEIGIEARLTYRGPASVPDLEATARAWLAAGATHIGVNTMGAGLAAPTDHVAALGEVKAMLDRL